MDGTKTKDDYHFVLWDGNTYITNKNKITVPAQSKMRKLKYSLRPVITGTMGTMNYQ